VKLALGTLFLWLGAAFLWLASHGLQASTPWGAYQTLIAKMREGEENAEAEAPAV
jgi:hypothetical protein